MFGKGISVTQQAVDDALALSALAGLHWALRMLVFANKAVWYWFALPYFAGHCLS